MQKGTGAESIALRPLSRADFPLLERWFRKPHVSRWWHETPDLVGLAAKYGPRIDGIERTHVWVIEWGKRAIGFIQWYHWADYPEHAGRLNAPPLSAGTDFAIGEEDFVGQGIGTAAIRKFLDQHVFINPEICCVLSDPETENMRSMRVFEKLGFRVSGTTVLQGEHMSRSVVRLDRPT